MKTHQTKILESLYEVEQIERPIREGIVDLLVSPSLRKINTTSNFLDGIDLILMQALEDIKRLNNIFKPFIDLDDVT